MIDRPPFRTALATALGQADASSFLSVAATTHRWLRLVQFIALAAAMVFASMAAVGILVGIVGGPMANSISQAVGSPIAEGPKRLLGENGFALTLAISIAMLAGAVLLAARVVYQRDLRSFVWPGRRFDRRQMLLGFVLMAAVITLILPFGLLSGDLPAPPIFNTAYPIETRFAYVGVMAAALLVAAAGEEIMLRSVVLQVSAGFMRRAWLICLINGLVFSAMHLDPDPIAFIARALSGIVWSWAAIRLGGIEFAVGAHWANNLYIALFLEPFSTAAEVGRKSTVADLAPELITAVIVLIFIERLARQRRLPPLAEPATT